MNPVRDSGNQDMSILHYKNNKGRELHIKVCDFLSLTG